MDETREYTAKGSESEKDKYHVEFKKQTSKRGWGEDKPRHRLLTVENKVMTTREEGVGKQVTGIKEGAYGEHWVLCGILESLFCTPETNKHCMFTGVKTKT